MNKQLQTNSNDKTRNCNISVLFSIALMLATHFCGAQTAYITNSNDNTVSVIDVITNKVVDTITVGADPIGVSVSSDGTKVYITNNGDNTVSVINTATNTVSATIPVSYPFGVSVSPDGNKVYVGGNDTVTVINTATNNSIEAKIPVGFGYNTNLWGISVSPDGSRVYVADEYQGHVYVINTATDTVLTEIDVGLAPRCVSVLLDGSKVYVSNVGDSTISIINTATNTVSTTLPVGPFPFSLSLSLDGTKLYVVNAYYNTARIINTTFDTVSDIITVDSNRSQIWGSSVSPDGSKLLVVNLSSSTVNVINTATNIITDSIAVGNTPTAFGNFISKYKQPTGIASYSIDAASISLFPNPANDQLTIHTSSFQNEAVMVSVINLLGQQTSPPAPLQMARGDATIDVAGLPSGMYFLQLKTESGSVVKKFVKE